MRGGEQGQIISNCGLGCTSEPQNLFSYWIMGVVDKDKLFSTVIWGAQVNPLEVATREASGC